MTKRLILVLVTSLVSLWCVSAWAQAKGNDFITTQRIPCNTDGKGGLAYIKEHYKEQPIVSLHSPRWELQVTLSESSRTWTIIALAADGSMCQLGAGLGYQLIPSGERIASPGISLSRTPGTRRLNQSIGFFTTPGRGSEPSTIWVSLPTTDIQRGLKTPTLRDGPISP